MTVVMFFLSNCRPDHGEVHVAKDSHVSDASSLKDEARLKRLGEMDVATAKWYLYQRMASDSFAEFVNNDVGPSEVYKSESKILSEQRAAIEVVGNDRSDRSAVLHWRGMQVMALNTLRECLGKEAFSATDEVSNLDLLDLQSVALNELEMERESLSRLSREIGARHDTQER